MAHAAVKADLARNSTPHQILSTLAAEDAGSKYVRCDWLIKIVALVLNGPWVHAEIDAAQSPGHTAVKIILQAARIYSDASGKIPGWRSAAGLYCKFNQCAV